MEHFKDEYLFLDVEGYTLFHGELDYVSSSPLFSWRKRTQDKRLHWGCQLFEHPNQSFWLTELCLIKGQDYVKHFIPGAYLKPRENSISAKTFRYIWVNIHDKYTFQREEIVNQSSVQQFLKDNITSETVLFFKGGQLERMIGELCGARDIVDIEDMGVSEKAVIPEPLVKDQCCKVHTRRFNHCPLQESYYFMDKIDEWLPSYLSYN